MYDYCKACNYLTFATLKCVKSPSLEVREQETLKLNDSMILKTSDANVRSLSSVLATGKMQNYSHSSDFVQHNRIKYGQPRAALVRVTLISHWLLLGTLYNFITLYHQYSLTSLISVYSSEVGPAPRSWLSSPQVYQSQAAETVCCQPETIS